MGWDGPLTQRQLVAWRWWLGEQWNRPTRTDQYLMSIATEVRRGNVEDPNSVQVQDLKLNFDVPSESKPLSIEEETRMAMAGWGAVLSKAKIVVPGSRLAGVAERMRAKHAGRS